MTVYDYYCVESIWLKIVNPPAASKRAGPDPDVNRTCRTGPSNTTDTRAGPGQADNLTDRDVKPRPVHTSTVNPLAPLISDHSGAKDHELQR